MWPMVLISDVYESLTASASFREAKRLYERARHDEAQALYNAKQKNSLELIQRMFHAGLPLNQIAEISNLPLSQIEALRTDWAQP